ncbi:MAG: hypothetical protein HQK65_22600 [Desulfamplus sp.]|nr:hypothetical protein [Desulfamplus sp.]
MPKNYSIPVQKILQLGEPTEYMEEWPDYLQYGFNDTHIQELIGLLSKDDLWSDGENKEDWGGVYAWRILGQLKAKEAIEPLYDFLRRNNEELSYTEIPEALNMIGLPALETSINIIKSPSEHFELKIVATEIMINIAQTNEEYCTDIIHVLAEEFKKYKTNNITLNAFLILGLVKLDCRDYLKEMESAFEEMRVDGLIMGNWEDVQAEFGQW